MLRGTVENLDIGDDWRYFSGKTNESLPPAGVEAIIGIHPNSVFTDAATEKLRVTRAAVAFHELEEARLKVEYGIPHTFYGAGPGGAHRQAAGREMRLLAQRPNFTQYPAGGRLRSRIQK